MRDGKLPENQSKKRLTNCEKIADFSIEIHQKISELFTESKRGPLLTQVCTTLRKLTRIKLCADRALNNLEANHGSDQHGERRKAAETAGTGFY
jgi:hypothetical protein